MPKDYQPWKLHHLIRTLGRYCSLLFQPSARTRSASFPRRYHFRHQQTQAATLSCGSGQKPACKYMSAHDDTSLSRHHATNATNNSHLSPDIVQCSLLSKASSFFVPRAPLSHPQQHSQGIKTDQASIAVFLLFLRTRPNQRLAGPSTHELCLRKETRWKREPSARREALEASAVSSTTASVTLSAK